MPAQLFLCVQFMRPVLPWEAVDRFVWEQVNQYRHYDHRELKDRLLQRTRGQQDALVRAVNRAILRVLELPSDELRRWHHEHAPDRLRRKVAGGGELHIIAQLHPAGAAETLGRMQQWAAEQPEKMRFWTVQLAGSEAVKARESIQHLKRDLDGSFFMNSGASPIANAMRVIGTLPDRRRGPTRPARVRRRRKGAPQAAAASTGPVHSADFTSVRWGGERYAFAPGHQASAVQALWREWENGGLSLSQATIAEKVGSEAGRFRMKDVFRGHPAWGEMIVKGDRKGTYKLAAPSPKP